MTHVIRQQFLHVEMTGTESDGVALQRSLPSLCRHWLVPAIEQAFERCGPSTGHFCIERLEIDAGTLPLDRLDHDLAASVAQAIENSLRNQLPLGEAPQTFNSSNAQHKTSTQALAEAVIYFLETGSLPWSYRPALSLNLEQVILHSWDEANSSEASRAVNDAILRVLDSITVRQRLIRQFSTAFLETLLTRLSVSGGTAMAEVLRTLRGSAVTPGELSSFERHLWETAFQGIAVGHDFTAQSLVKDAWRALPVKAAGYTTLADVLERHWAITTDRTQRSNSRSAQTSGTDDHPEAARGIYVENAGVVLLHPFLPQLFTELGIAAEDKLLRPDLALCLLHFLITGQTVAPEYELVLPKILCNVPLATPVECNLDLTDAEKAEGMAMLEALVRHWEALRSTSVDGLRGTFFLRPGKVSRRDDGDWLLQVEPKAFDILLDRLPWGIGMIKLPWMSRVLWVEWK